MKSMAFEPVGTIKEIWRYPISSLGGERLNAVELNAAGIEGDRAWCLVDARSGHAAAPEMEHRWRAALFLHSRLRSGKPEIGFPDGEWIAAGHDDLEPRLNDHFKFDVELRPYAGMAGPDYAHVPIALNRYIPSPLHLITTGSLDRLTALSGAGDFDSRRFRPAVLLQTDAAPAFHEASWVGRKLHLGSAVLQGSEETKRCGMTLIPQPGLAENPDILRNVLRHNKRNLGIYCSITRSGLIALGDQAWLDDA